MFKKLSKLKQHLPVSMWHAVKSSEVDNIILVLVSKTHMHGDFSRNL